MSKYSGCRDHSFGPSVPDCSRFDFTLVFEDTILSLLPSCIFLVVGLTRWLAISTRRPLVASCAQRWIKLGALGLYTALQLAILIVVAFRSQWRVSTSLPAVAFVAACSILLCILSNVEHSRSLRPSTIILVYLFLTVIFDIVRSRTLWLLYPTTSLSILTVVSVSMKCVVLVLESSHKSKHFLSEVGHKSSEEICGVIDLSLSIWLKDILQRGLCWRIKISDLPDMTDRLSSRRLEYVFDSQWAKHEVKARTHYTFLWCCINVLKWPFLAAAPLRLAQVAFALLQPILLHALLSYLQQTNPPVSNGRGLVGAFVLVYFGNAVSYNLYWYFHTRTITKLRAILVTAISKHTEAADLRLLEDSKFSITLMSSDVERIVQGLKFFHETWGNAVQVIVAVYILERQAGVSCVVPVALTIATSACVGWLSRSIGPRQIRWMEAVEKRIGASSRFLDTAKGVKMKGTEDKYYKLIDELRSRDIKCGNAFRTAVAYVGILSLVPEFICPFFTFWILVAVPSISGGTFDAARIFTILATQIVLTQPLANGYQMIPPVLAAIGSMKRIGAYLLTEQYNDSRAFPNSARISITELDKEEKQPIVIAHDQGLANTGSESTIFRVVNGSFGWGGSSTIFSDLNISIDRGALTIVTGAVGSGKSTLCEILLGQMRKVHGEVYIGAGCSTVAYCSQTPFLTNTSIKSSILAYGPYEPAWYKEVVNAIGLSDDIGNMPRGDETIIGSNGSKLSGGQRQRLSIARAVYSRQQTMIFDDVFSGQDPRSAQIIFTNLFGSNGLLRRSRTTTVLVTHDLKYLPSADHIIILEKSGIVVAQGSYSSIQRLLGYEHYLSDIVTSYDNTPGVSEAPRDHVESTKESARDENEQRLRSSDEWSIYGFYARAVGSLHLSVLLFVSVAGAAFYTYSSLWLKRWADYTAINGGDMNAFYLGIYTIFQCLTIAFLFAVAIQSLTNVASHSGRRLHTILLRSVVYAPLSFLTKTDAGHIINRFSQDIQLVDSELPIALMNFFVCSGCSLGQVVLITVVSPWTGLAFVPIGVILYALQKYYLRTSKQLRILDLEAKTPLYAHFLNIVTGLSTIRAFGWTEAVHGEMHDFLEHSQKPNYILYMIQEWLNFVLQLIVAIVTTVIVSVAITLNTRSSSVGVAIIQIISFNGMMRQTIVSWTQMETSFAAIARIRDFQEQNDSDHEVDTARQDPPAEWPSEGRIDFKNVSAVYSSSPDHLVLQHIDLSINPGEKIGICGRSGSGKSSFALSLLSMTSIVAGSIIIDGLDLQMITPKTTRARLNAVPQDPSFMPGSFRLNLEPSTVKALPDSTLIDALKRVLLWEVVEASGGLDAELKESSFSHGQRQLFSLAGALLRPSKIVILDEFTSSVDVHTDSIMQQVIRDGFTTSTMIFIAHRLDTIMSCHRIIMLENGCVVEYGPPTELLARGAANSVFASFIQEKTSQHNES